MLAKKVVGGPHVLTPRQTTDDVANPSWGLPSRLRMVPAPTQGGASTPMFGIKGLTSQLIISSLTLDLGWQSPQEAVE